MALDRVRGKNKISYLDVFDFLPETVLLIDPKNYNILDVNNAYLKKLGISRDKIIGRECFEVIHKKSRPCRGALEKCPLKETLRTGKANIVEHIHYDKQRKPYYIEVLTSLVKPSSGKRKVLLHLSRNVPLHNHLNKSIDDAGKRYLKCLKNLAMNDQLTGVYNYQYLMERLPVEVYRARRYNDPFSLAIIDIDYFKSINDIYGYQSGDLLLSDFSNYIKKQLRQSDILTRYSGEEFIILMPKTGKLDTLFFTNRLLTNISGKIFRIKKVNIKLKVSIGTATFSEDGRCDSAHRLLNALDQALRRAKDTGGNRAIDYSDLYKEKKVADKKINTYDEVSILKRKVKNLSDSVDRVVLESIYAFAKSLEARDYYTAEHAEEMVSLVLRLGVELGLSKEMLNNLEKGAMLHDIGKIGISDAILRKKSKLTHQEYRVIKNHPKIGAEIIRAIHFLKEVVPVVLHHHEKWNGKGYPSGLKEREIPLLARIVSITDAYQALISDRPYRKAFSKKKAHQILKNEAGISYDKDIVDVLIKMETRRNSKSAKKH